MSKNPAQITNKKNHPPPPEYTTSSEKKEELTVKIAICRNI